MTADKKPVGFSISEDWSGAIPLHQLLPQVPDLPVAAAIPRVSPRTPRARVCFTEEIVSHSDRLDTQESALDEDPSLVGQAMRQVDGWDDLEDSAFTATVASVEPQEGGVLRDLLAPSQSVPMAELVTVKGHPVSRFKVNRGGISFGRSEACGVVLLQRTASRQHAQVSWESGSFVIRDLDSSNGVYVNERRVAEAVLESGDVVEVGDAVFAWVQPHGAPQLDEATRTQEELTEPWEGQLWQARATADLGRGFTAPAPKLFVAPPSPLVEVPPRGLPPAIADIPEGPTGVSMRPAHRPLPARAPRPESLPTRSAAEFELAGPRQSPRWVRGLALGLAGVALCGVAALGYSAADAVLGGRTAAPAGDPVAYSRYMDQGARSIQSGDFGQAALDFGLADRAMPGQADARRMWRYAQEFQVLDLLSAEVHAAAQADAAAAATRERVLDTAAVAAAGRSRQDVRAAMASVEALTAQLGEDRELARALDQLRVRLAYLGPAPKRLTAAQQDARAQAERCERAVANRDHRTAYRCLTRLVAADRSARLPGGQKATAALAEVRAHLSERAEPYHARGISDLAAERPGSARDAFEAALRILPDHVPSKEGLVAAQAKLDEQASEHMTRARVYEQAHRTDKALAEYGKALDLAGKDSRAGRLAAARIAELVE